MRTLQFIISGAMGHRTVKSILAGEMRLSDSLISRVKMRPSGFLLNGQRVYTNARVRPGDVLEVEVGDDPARPRAVPMAYPLQILWEDQDLLILNKPAGLAVHQSTRDPNECTLENALSAYLSVGDYVHPVSRLDRGTTGIMTVAKNGYVHDLLRRMLHTEDFTREYLGLARGLVEPESGMISLPIGFSPGSNYKRAVREGGQASVTQYSTVHRRGGCTLLRLIPRTGRTHQLRVHMAAIGFPLVGDWLYGEQDEAMARPALHSHTLWLKHPLTGEILHLTADLPEDMEARMRAELQLEGKDER